MKKILKIAALLFLALVLLAIVAPAFLSPGWEVEESVTIQASPGVVFPHVAQLRNWGQWTLWRAEGSDHLLEYDGPAEGVGAVLRWSSPGSTGELTVTHLEPQSLVAYDILMEEGRGRSAGEIRLAAEGSTTRVTWVDRGDFLMDGEPMVEGVAAWFVRLGGAFMKNRLSSEFQDSLQNLKKLAEE